MKTVMTCSNGYRETTEADGFIDGGNGQCLLY
jgi:hypothetical protein